MPRSNKRTASLPNPHPIGLQSCCFILPGSLFLGLHQATAPRQTHTQWDPPLSGQTPPRYPPLSHASLQPPDSHHTGIPTTWLCRWIHEHRDPHHQAVPDPSLEPVPQLTRIPALAGMPAPPEPTILQAVLSPSHAWDDWIPTPQTPVHQTLQGAYSMWKNWSPDLLGQAAAWHETAASTSLPVTLPVGWSRPPLYRPPR
jgi:hypothetical protein